MSQVSEEGPAVARTRAREALDRTGRWLRLGNGLLLAVAGSAIALLTLVIALNVILRYGFQRPLPWALDVSRILLAYAFFCALAPALQWGAHVAVEIVHERLAPGNRRWLLAVASFISAGYGTVLVYQWWRLFWEAWTRDRTFSGNVPIPEAYVLVAAPVGGLAFLVTASWQFLSHLAGAGELVRAASPAQPD